MARLGQFFTMAVWLVALHILVKQPEPTPPPTQTVSEKGIDKMTIRTFMEKVWETDKFACSGRVSPTEYNWRDDFHHVARYAEKHVECILPMDVGKVLGLCAYIDELEGRLSSLTSDLATPRAKIED